MTNKTSMFSHFITIGRGPGKFVFWLLTAIVLSLSSIWLPALTGYTLGENWLPKIMDSNPLILFSIVFLFNTIFSAFNEVGVGSTIKAVSTRSIAIAITLLYLMYLISLSQIKYTRDYSLPSSFQMWLLIGTVALGIYIYGFREKDWEKSADDVVNDQSEVVEEVTRKAELINDDGSEVKL